MAEDNYSTSVYLSPSDDSKLRQLAVDFNVTKPTLIRAAIRLKVTQWEADPTRELVRSDATNGAHPDQDEPMVLRVIFILLSQDMALRQFAFALNVTKSTLIRAAIRLKLQEWLNDETRELALKEIAHGVRQPQAELAATN